MEEAKTTNPVTLKSANSAGSNVTIGGGAPIAVQSMLNADPLDLNASLEQLKRLEDAGCEIVRVAVPHADSLSVFEQLCAQANVPIVADIHFDHRLAIEAAKRGAAKLRINPGNIGSAEKTAAVIETARECDIPIRIGVNAGSLADDIASMENVSFAEKLALSAIEQVDLLENDLDFHDIVVSAKAHSVPQTIEAYRLLHEKIPHIPLHIGVTEAGTATQGIIKSSAGLGILLEQGIGDTIRISLTDDPVLEVEAAWHLLSALGLRQRFPELISCPTCGRCRVDLIPIAKEVERRISKLEAPIKVAVMGCVVNGPGEAKDADVGIASGEGTGALFRHGEVIRKVDEREIVDALMDEINDILE